MSDSNITKNALALSMKKLMRQKPFEKISVSDICSDCGINRKSFYYHFRDKYDLVNWIFYIGFIGGMDLSRYTTGWDWLEDVCRYFYSEREFYRAALRIEGQNSFRDYLTEMVRPIEAFFLRDIFQDSGDEEFFTTFVGDALLTSLLRWLSGGYDREMDAQEFLTRVRWIVLGLADNIRLRQDAGTREDAPDAAHR